MDIGLLRGVLTAAAFFGFVSLVVWAWSSRRRGDFDAAARLPLEQDQPATHRKGDDA